MTIYECLGIEHLLMDIPIPEETVLDNLDDKYYFEARTVFRNIDYISLRVSLNRDEHYLQVMEIGLNTPKQIDKIAQYIQKAIKYRILFVFVYQDHSMILWRNFKLTDSTEYVYTDAVSYCTDWFYEETLNDDVLWTCNSIKIDAERTKISPLTYKKKNKKDDGGLAFFRDVISNVYRLCSTMINRDIVCARFLMDWFDCHAMGHRLDLNHVICQSILDEMYMIIDDHLFFDRDRLEVLCSTIENPNYRYKVKIGRTGRVPWRYFEDIAFPATLEDEAYTLSKVSEVIDSDGHYFVDILNDATVSLNAQDIKKTQVEQKNLWYRMTEKQLAQKRREEEYRKAVEEERRQEELRQAEEARRRAEEEKRAEEARRKAEEAKQEAARRRAERKLHREETRRKAEEEKRAEEARRKAEEAKRTEEARRKAEEAKRAEDARRKAEEAKCAEEALRKAEEAKRAEKARRKAEEAKRAEDARRKAEEAKRAEEARRKAEEAKRAEEARHKAEEAKRAEEALCKAEEAKRAEEARRKAEEKMRREEARRKSEEAIRPEKALRRAEEKILAVDDKQLEIEGKKLRSEILMLSELLKSHELEHRSNICIEENNPLLQTANTDSVHDLATVLHLAKSQTLSQLLFVLVQIKYLKQKELQIEATQKAEEYAKIAKEAKRIEAARLRDEARRKVQEKKRLERLEKEQLRRKAEETRRIEELRKKDAEIRRQNEIRRGVENARRQAELERQRIITERRSQNRCQHCGGEFKSFLGIFAKKCRNCGLPKDY